MAKRPHSHAAIKAFQRKHGLKVDGIVGRRTRAAGWGRAAPKPRPRVVAKPRPIARPIARPNPRPVAKPRPRPGLVPIQRPNPYGLRAPVGFKVPGRTYELWDEEADYETQTATAARARLLQQYATMEQDVNLASTEGLRSLAQQRPGAERGLLNSFAARGMARSSGYGLGVGSLQNDFANQENSILANKTRGLGQIVSGRAEAQQGYLNDIQRIKTAAARRLGANALNRVRV